MARYLAFALFSLVPAVCAIQCFSNYNGMQLPEGTVNQTTLTCAPGVNTCIKNFDLNSKLFSKGCGNLYTNCTNPQQLNAPVANICYNTTGTTTFCCCNTDTCNPAPSHSLYYVFGSVGALFLARMF